MEKRNLDIRRRRFFIALAEADRKQNYPFAKLIESKGDSFRKTIKTHDFKDEINRIYPDFEGDVLNRIIGEYKGSDSDKISYEGFLHILSDISADKRKLDRYLEDAYFSLRNSEEAFLKDLNQDGGNRQEISARDIESLFRKYGASISDQEKDLLLFFFETQRTEGRIDVLEFKQELSKYFKTSMVSPRDSMRKSKRTSKERIEIIKQAFKNKGVTVDKYFEGFGYDPRDRKVPKRLFERGLKDLNLDFTEFELEIIEGELMSNEMYDIELFRDEEKPTSVSNPKLDFMFEETLNKIKKDNINLTSEFKMHDDKSTGSISVYDFKKIFSDKIYALNEETVNAVIDKYGNPRKGIIDYRHLTDDFEAFRKKLENSMTSSMMLSRADTLKFENKLKEFYKKVKNKYRTFEEFVRKFDKNDNDRIEKDEFAKAVQSLIPEAEQKEIDYYYTNFDQKNGYLDPMSFKRAFKSLMDVDAKAIIDGLSYKLHEQKKSLLSVIEKFPNAGETIPVKYVAMAIQSISSAILEDDVYFLISYFNIKITANQTVDYERLCSRLDEYIAPEKAKDRTKNNLFARSDTQMSLGSNSTENPDKKNKVLTDFAKKMKFSDKEKIIDMFTGMVEQGKREVSFPEFKKYVKRIVPDYTDIELNDIFRQIDVSEKKSFTVLDLLEKVSPVDPTAAQSLRTLGSKVFDKSETQSDVGGPKSGMTSAVNTERNRDIYDKTKWAKEVFIEIKMTLISKDSSLEKHFRISQMTCSVDSFKAYLEDLKINNEHVTRLAENLTENRMINLDMFEKAFRFHSEETKSETKKVNPYSEIKKELKKQGTDLEVVFKDLQKQGSIKKNMFKDVLDRKLNIPLNEKQLQAIQDENADSTGDINLNRLKAAITEAKEQVVDADVKELLNKIKDSSKRNKNSIDDLFKLFDKDGDGHINFLDFKEFVKPFEKSMTKIADAFKSFARDDDPRISRMEFYKIFEEVDDRYKRLVLEIRRNFAKQNRDLHKEFERYDDLKVGNLNLKGFTDIIKSSDAVLDNDDILLLFERSQGTLRDAVKKEDFMRIFYELSEAELKHIKDLIREAHNKVLLMKKPHAQSLLDRVDKANMKRVSFEEFSDVIQLILPGLLSSEPPALFNYIDKNRNGFILLEEFAKTLGFAELLSTPEPPNLHINDEKNLGKSVIIPEKNEAKGQKVTSTYKDLGKEELIMRTGWASDYFEEIGYLIGAEETNIEDFFRPGKEITIEKITVKKQLRTLALDISDELFDRLIQYFTSSEHEYKINVIPFVEMIYYFNAHPKKSLDEFKLKHLDKIRDDILTKLTQKKLKFAEAFNHLSKNDLGTCYRVDLQSYLVSKLDVPNNTNLKLLFSYIKDGTGEVNLGRLEFFLNELMRSQIKPTATGVKPIDEEDVNIQKLIRRVKMIIEDSRLKVENVFKQFDASQDQELSYEEFYRGLKYFDNKLTRQEIWSIFTFLDNEKRMRIPKIKFVRTFGKLNPELMMSLLDWAFPIFREMSDLQIAKKIDLFASIFQDDGFCDKLTFRTSLIMNDFPFDNYRKEMEKIMDIAADETTGRVNIVAIRQCVEKAKNVRMRKLPSQFTTDEDARVKLMIKDIANFIKLDGLSFDDLFLQYDHKKDARISIPDLHKVLVEDLRINPNPTLELLYDYLIDEENMIDLVQLRKLVIKEHEELKKYLNLPYFLKELKQKFNNDIPFILKFFDPNKNKMISLEEFINACMRALNMKPDFSRFYFLQLDEDQDGQISITEFQEQLLQEGDIKWEKTKAIRDEIEKKRIVLARNFSSFDKNNDKMLTLQHLKAVFSMSEIYMDEHELEELLYHYKVEPDKARKYDYTKLIEKILTDSDEEERYTLAERTLSMLKNKFVVGNINYDRDFEFMDEAKEGKIFWKLFEQYLSQRNIPISNLEKQNLRWLLKPTVDDKISWRNLVEYIHLGVNRVMTKEELLEEGNLMKDFILAIKYQMKRNFYSVSRLFGTDKDVIPTDDFKTAISYLGFKSNLNLPKLCKLVSEGKSGEFASLPKFEFLIHGIEDPRDGFERAEKELKSGMMLEYFPNKDPKDVKFIEQRFEDIRKFMIEDKFTFKDLFTGLNVIVKDGLLFAKDFERILIQKLQLDIDPTLKKFIRLLIDSKEMINVEMLERLIDAPKVYQEKKVVNDLTSSAVTRSNVPTLFKNVNQGNAVQFKEKENLTTPKEKEDAVRDLSDVLNGAILVDYSGDLIRDIQVFLRGKKLTNQDRYRLFDNKLVGKVARPKFVEIVKAMNIRGARETDIQAAFTKLDKNKTDYISENEFRLAFDEEDAKTLATEYNLNKDMQQEIISLFKQIDEDESGFITLDEFIRSLSKIGMTASQREAAEIFEKFDKSKDGKIDFEEFKVIMADKMKKEMMQLDDLLAELREAFRVVDTMNRRELNESQLYQALLTLGIELSEAEIKALFTCLDINNSGTIDIDEFIGFIMSPPERDTVPDEADNAIYNIRKGRKISPSELLASFKDMPYNFVFSFTREFLKKLICLPSSTLKPKTTAGVLYTDILPNRATVAETTTKSKNSQPVNLRSHQPIPSTIAAEIKLVIATGVPIPDAKLNRDNLIAGREVRACLFDRMSNKFLGNLVYIPVDWKAQKEDEWTFPPDEFAEDCTFYLRMSDWDTKSDRDMQLMIVFELVIFVKRNAQLVEMSSSWAGLDVHLLRKSGNLELTLVGGSPLRVAPIDAQDVRTTRKGWRSVVKKLSSPVRSKLKIEFKSMEKLPQDIKNDLEFLPGTILLNRNALPLYLAYREYLGKTYLDALDKNISIDLTNDLNAKAFRKIIDCPDTRNVLLDFWNNAILSKYRKERDPALSVVYLEKTMTYLNLLLNCQEFRFNHSDPTGVTLLNKNLSEIRLSLAVMYMKKALEDVTNLDIRKKPQNKAPKETELLKDLTFKPFSMDEFMDEENDLYLVDQIKNLRGGARK